MTHDEARALLIESGQPGWVPLLERLFARLPAETSVESVYEKWATLRFDLRPDADADTQRILDEIEELSRGLCEICGEAAVECVDDGWLRALCIPHARSMNCIVMDNGEAPSPPPATND